VRAKLGTTRDLEGAEARRAHLTRGRAITQKVAEAMGHSPETQKLIDWFDRKLRELDAPEG
jgi:hypothetical protein